jgi:hypothetical protein
MSSSKADDHRVESTDSEYVTNWKVVATFIGLMILPLCGAACWVLVMRTSDSEAPSNHSAATADASDSSSSYAGADNRAEADKIDESMFVPWRPLPEKAPVVFARADFGDVNSKTDDQPLAPPAIDQPKVSVKVDADSEGALVAYIDVYESQLLDDLEKQSVELDFEAVKGSTEKVLSRTLDGEKLRSSLLAKRTDLRGLPFRGQADCKKGLEEAKPMQEVSTTIGRIATSIRSRRTIESSGYAEFEAEDKLITLLEEPGMWRRPKYVSTLVQMLQVDSLVVRQTLVSVLADIKGNEATEALVERAIFDTLPEVRDLAITALKSRASADYRDRLLEGFRYPWPAVSVYAARALVALDDQDSVPGLVALLDKSDPSAPFVDQEGKWSKRELVRVNHMRNCVLCHAPSRSSMDLVRGLVPTPGKPIPVVYYQSRHGSFVRADVTYLKQDFSVMQQVANADPWPSVQRFDYFVRDRQATLDEIAAVESAVEDGSESDAHNPKSYLQREAVLMALRKLTGENPGDSSESWRAFLASRSN